MARDTIERALGQPPSRPLGVRLAWFFGIAAASALAVGIVAEGLRWLLLH